MIVLWIVISAVLTTAWLCLTIGFIFMAIDDGIDKEEWQIGCAISCAGLLFALFHWIVLLLVIPAFFLYSLVQVVKVVKNKTWKEFA